MHGDRNNQVGRIRKEFLAEDCCQTPAKSHGQMFVLMMLYLQDRLPHFVFICPQAADAVEG